MRFICLVCPQYFFEVENIKWNSRRTAESYDNSVFNLLRSHQTVFTVVTPLHMFTSKRMRVPNSPHPHQHLLLFVFFIPATLMRVKWYLTVVWFYIFPIANNVEHFSRADRPFVYLFWRNSQVFFPFKKLGPLTIFVIVEL